MNIILKNPSMLWALWLIAIPIILHILNLRRHKTIYFSNVNILKYIEKESKNKSKLKDLLILLARILFITALVFAFAQPFIPSQTTVETSKEEVFIYIDNSFSMNSKGQNGPLLEEAKNIARNIVDAYGKNTLFSLITNNYTGLPNSKGKTIDAIGSVKSSPKQKQLNELFFQTQSSKQKHLYILSDFQKNALNVENIVADTISSYFFIPLKAESSKNISIDSCWFNSPYLIHGKNEELTVTLTNHSKQEIKDIPLQLYINDTTKAIQSLTIGAKKSVSAKLAFLNNYKGDCFAKIQIEDLPITYDNILYSSFSVSEEIKILIIQDKTPSDNIEYIYDKSDTYFNTTTVDKDKLNYSELDNYNAIILNEISFIGNGLQSSLIQFIKNGGNVLLIPNMEVDQAKTHNQLLDEFGIVFSEIDNYPVKLKTINLRDNIYENTFDKIPDNSRLPEISKHTKIAKSNFSNTELLSLQNNDALLLKNKKGDGIFYCFTTQLSKEEELKIHPVIVPTFLNIALFSKPTPPLYYTLGINKHIDYKGPKAEIVELSDAKSSFSVIPPLYRYSDKSVIEIPHEELKDGHFFIQTKDKVYRKKIALNYNKHESEQEYVSNEELLFEMNQAGLKNVVFFSKNLQLDVSKALAGQLGRELWIYCILGSIVFIFLEIAFIKFT